MLEGQECDTMDVNLFVYGLVLCSLVASESLDKSAASNNRVDKKNLRSTTDRSNEVTYAEKSVEGDIGNPVQNNSYKEGKGRNINAPLKCVQLPVIDDTETSSGESKNHVGKSESGSGESGSGSGESSSGSGESDSGSGEVQMVKVETLQTIQVTTESNNVNTLAPTDATTSEKFEKSIENANKMAFVSTSEPIHKTTAEGGTGGKEKPRTDGLYNTEVVNEVVGITADTTRESTAPNTTPISTTSDTTSVSTTPDRTAVRTTPDATPISTTPDTSPVSITPDRTAVRTTPDTSPVSTTSDRTRTGTTPDTTLDSTAPDTTLEQTTPSTTPDSTTQGSMKLSSKGEIATSIKTLGEMKTPISESNFNSVETIIEQEDINGGGKAPSEDIKKRGKAKKPRIKMTFTQGMIIGSAFVIVPTVVLVIFVARLLRKRAKVGVVSV